MPENQSDVAFRKFEGNEEQHKRNSHNDFAVDDRNLVDVFHHASGFFAEAENAYCGERAKHRGSHRRNRRNEKRVLQRRHKLRSFFTGENGLIGLEAESVAEAEVRGVGEAVDDDKKYRRVEERKDNIDIGFAQNFFYHIDLLTSPERLNLLIK